MVGNSTRIGEILAKHFSGTIPETTLQRVAQEIAGLGDEWEESEHLEESIGAEMSVQCDDICLLAQMYHSGQPLRVFKKRK